MTTNNPTDTNQASELFELCKQVYEATGWDDLADDHDWFTERGVIGYERNGLAPLYTSDYLLEKLRDSTFVIRLFAMSDEIVEGRGYQGDYCASYRMKWGDFNDGYYASTPLEALLKLTIALSEVGELDNDQSS